jgi:hypothetical protein
VRLDHLLSKEHLAPLWGVQACRHQGECPWSAAHGWNIDIGIGRKSFDLVRPLRWVGTVGVGGAGACTLLGPEGPGAVLPRVRIFGCGVVVGRVWTLQAFIEAGTWCRRGWGFWPSVENYIVDASILEAAFGLFHNR